MTTQITAECPCGDTLLVKAPTRPEARAVLEDWTGTHERHHA